MKKVISVLITVTLFVLQMSAFAMPEGVKVNNEKYLNYISEAIEKSRFNEEQIDKDNIYVVEHSTPERIKNKAPATEFVVALPILDTNNTAYTFFYDCEYRSETLNSAALLHVEKISNSKIDEYLENNGFDNVSEIANTKFYYGRQEINAYRVVEDDKAYFIPYYLFSDFNVTDDESCSLEIGKAYEENEFVKICENERIAFAEYDEQKRKEEEAAKYAAEHPVISLDENGDEYVSIAGVNLDEVKKEILANVDIMEEDTYVIMEIVTEDICLETEHRYESGSSKKELADFVNGLFEELYLQAANGKVSSTGSSAYCGIKIRYKADGSWVHYSPSLYIGDGWVKLLTENHGDISFKVKNSDVILNYMANYADDGFNTFINKRYDERTPEILGTLEGLTKTDIVEFEYLLPSDADNSLTKEVSSPGKTIKGIFEKYKENKYRSTYILTLSGNLGTVSFYEKTQSSLNGDEEYLSNNIPVTFLNELRYENDKLVEYKVGKEPAYYSLKMVFNDNDISKVYLDNTECESLEYTQLTEDTKLSDVFVERSKEVAIREAKECADTLYDIGLFKGTDKGYELEKSLTREESATILVRLLGEEEKVDADDYEAVFDDVEEDRWSYACIMYCYKNNITKGTSDSTFSPDVQIDAEQFITLLLRLLGYTQVNPDTAFDKSIEYNLLNKEMVEDLKQADMFTRSEMVQIVYNCLKTQMDDETVFADFLLDKGILTQEEIELIK